MRPGCGRGSVRSGPGLAGSGLDAALRGLVALDVEEHEDRVARHHIDRGLGGAVVMVA